jgi:hypothetical protein
LWSRRSRVRIPSLTPRKAPARRALFAFRVLGAATRVVVVSACALSLSPHVTKLLASNDHLPHQRGALNPLGIGGALATTSVWVSEGLPPTPRPGVSEAIEVTVRRYMGGSASI